MIHLVDTTLSRHIDQGLFLVLSVVIGANPVLEPISSSTYLHFINEKAVSLAVHLDLPSLGVRLWHKVFKLHWQLV